MGTAEHPFYVRVPRAGRAGAGGGDDEAAGEWVAGDEVLRAGGGWAAVTGVEAEGRAADVYNFEVEDNHNYFVGEHGVLVHNNCTFATLISQHYGKLQSILARRGAQWGFSGPVNRAHVEAFAHMIDAHVQNAPEVWQAVYRGSDRLFYIDGNKVVVTQLNGAFESAWEATAAQLAHYRSGTRVR